MIGGLASGGPAVQALRALETQIRSDLWNRWVATAQRRALLWWRDRTTPPGVAARFTAQGAAFYRFGKRLTRRNPPYYLREGTLRTMLLQRKPKTRQANRNAGKVETRLAYGGGILNFLDQPKMRPIDSYVTETHPVTFVVSSHTRKPPGGAANSVQVVAYTMSRSEAVRKRVPASETYAQQFGQFVRDRPAIEARVLVELRRIVRSAAYDKRTGLIKSAALRGGEDS